MRTDGREASFKWNEVEWRGFLVERVEFGLGMNHGGTEDTEGFPRDAGTWSGVWRYWEGSARTPDPTRGTRPQMAGECARCFGSVVGKRDYAGKCGNMGFP